jgi:hypothetical protein
VDIGISEPEILFFEAMPGDGTKLWFGIWMVPRTTTLDRGLECIASLDGDLFTDVEGSTPADVELGQMPAKIFYGTATVSVQLETPQHPFRVPRFPTRLRHYGPSRLEAPRLSGGSIHQQWKRCLSGRFRLVNRRR